MPFQKGGERKKSQVAGRRSRDGFSCRKKGGSGGMGFVDYCGEGDVCGGFMGLD